MAIKKVGPCGGTGGSAQDMKTDDISRILKISVRHGAAIDGLTVTFEDKNHQPRTESWGGLGGNLDEFNIPHGEHITSVKGHYGSFGRHVVVKSLKFHTNLLRSFGPYGNEEGIPFELPAITGQIISFHGRSGTYLDALGVHVKVNNTTGGPGGGGNTGTPGT